MCFYFQCPAEKKMKMRCFGACFVFICIVIGVFVLAMVEGWMYTKTNTGFDGGDEPMFTFKSTPGLNLTEADAWRTLTIDANRNSLDAFSTQSPTSTESRGQFQLERYETSRWKAGRPFAELTSILSSIHCKNKADLHIWNTLCVWGHI